ncbi:hypothetical protein DPMN_060916, partial [Dreissena polymorpha]
MSVVRALVSNLCTVQPKRHKHNPRLRHGQIISPRRPNRVFTRRIAVALGIDPRSDAESVLTSRTFADQVLMCLWIQYYACSVTDKIVDGGGGRDSLMERLRGRVGQHRSWTDTVKTLKLIQMNDKHRQSNSIDKSCLQTCLDKLHRAMKITNQQTLIERLDLISRQLGMIFTPSTVSDNQVALTSEMFKVIVIFDGQSGVRDVKISHQDTPTSCEELVDVLRKGDFDEFISHLQGLLSIYSFNGDKKQKSKGYLALSTLEHDLNLIAQLQSSINGVTNYIHKSSLGILLPRRGGHPMKLIYYVSPYDLLCKKSKSTYPMTLE